MLEAVADRYRDPLMGLHLAGAIQPATFGAIGYLMQTCTSFVDVFKVATRYNGLLGNIGKTSLRHRPGAVQVCWEDRQSGGSGKSVSVRVDLGGRRFITTTR